MGKNRSKSRAASFTAASFIMLVGYSVLSILAYRAKKKGKSLC